VPSTRPWHTSTQCLECLAHSTTGSIERGLRARNLGWTPNLRWDPAAATIHFHSVVAQLRCGSGSRAVWPGRIAKSGRCDRLHSHACRRRYFTTASRRPCRGVAALTDQPTKSASDRDAPDGQAVSGKPLAMPVWRSGHCKCGLGSFSIVDGAMRRALRGLRVD
jgi:hypothetical protein